MTVAGSFGTLFELGFEHIFSAHDHLVFLVGLLLVCRSPKQLALIVLTFTVAHSATLLMAGGHWIRLPAAWIDPLIAATIAVVGVENMVRRGEPRHRLLEVFVFGLLHGFGFAHAIREELPGLAGTELVRPMLGFNLGVEAGQVLAAAIAFPLIAWLREHGRVGKYVAPVGSGAVAACGFFWLVRALF